MPTKNGLVGYGQPPEHGKFKKGKSGNPSGRPKRRTTFKDDLEAELQETVLVTDAGHSSRITKQRLLIKTLTNAAIQNDMRATNALLGCMRFFGVGNDEGLLGNVDEENLEMAERYLMQQHEGETRSNTSANDSDNNPDGVENE